MIRIFTYNASASEHFLAKRHNTILAMSFPLLSSDSYDSHIFSSLNRHMGYLSADGRLSRHSLSHLAWVFRGVL